MATRDGVQFDAPVFALLEDPILDRQGVLPGDGWPRIMLAGGIDTEEGELQFPRAEVVVTAFGLADLERPAGRLRIADFVMDLVAIERGDLEESLAGLVVTR
jgi:hypothetical protein